MTHVLFYNAITGSAAIGDLTSKSVSTTKVFPDGSIQAWTHIVQIQSGAFGAFEKNKLFFYNKDTRNGAIGVLEETSLTMTKDFPPDSFGSWTHVAAVGPLLFFYDKNSGAAAIATTEPEKLKLEKSSTDIIQKPDIEVKPEILNQHENKDSSVISEVLKGPKFPHLPETQELLTITSYAQGSFGTWTHVVASGPYLFFYNEATGAASLGKLVNEDLTTIKDFASGGKASLRTIKDFPNGSFSGWTHIVGAAPYLFFYNEDNRAGSIGKISENGFNTVKDFPQGNFGTWTHICAAASLPAFPKMGSPTAPPTGGPFDGNETPLLFYNTHSGAGALGKLAKDTFETVTTFGDGSFGNWTSISGTSASADPYAVGYRVTRTSASLRILSHDGTETEVNIPDEELSLAEKNQVIDTSWEKIIEFIKQNAADIKSGKIKAVDIGGELFGLTASAIVMVFAPVAGLTLIGRIASATFVEASKQAGRYYGYAVDELVKTLKGQNEATLTKIIATFATVHVVASYIPGAAVLGKDAWSLTQEIGATIGGVVDEAINTITKAVGAAINAAAKTPGEVKSFLEGVFDDIF